MSHGPFLKRFDLVDRCLGGGVLLLLGCYTAVFVISPGARDTFPSVLVDALINVGVLALWGALAWWINLHDLLDRPIRLHALAHPVLGFAFAVAWYFSATVLLGWRACWFALTTSSSPWRSTTLSASSAPATIRSCSRLVADI